MDWMRVLKDYGLPTVLAIGLGLLLREQMHAAQEQAREAAKERAEHTVILIDQMSALRHACDPKAP